jgi:tRNA-specific 2-thiouridylase
MSRDSRVILGMSGGVDSSVAAHLLLEDGYRVEGLFMKNWDEDDETGQCSAAADLADASAVCDRLEIPLHKVSFASEYWDRVFEYFLAEYRAGRTPNPDVMCNKEIKFNAFLDYALGLGAERIATGHYARIGRDADGHTLLRGLDPDKDQSYFLHSLGQRELAHALFPVGELQKPDVRGLARRLGLPNHAKKDSTGICFIGERRFKDFLQRYLPAQPGEIVDPEGQVLGHHDGLMYYTLGQRHGLGLGGRRDAREAPWFVAGKDMQRNHLIAVQDHGHPLLMSRILVAQAMHWVSGSAPGTPLRCTARIRYRQADQPCTVEREGPDRWRVRFDQQQRAVTPGQSVVLYQGECCLGGGVIEHAEPAC